MTNAISSKSKAQSSTAPTNGAKAGGGIDGQIKSLEAKKAGLESQISNIEARANQAAGPHQQRANEELNKPMGGFGAGLRGKAAQNTANTIAAPIMKEAEPIKAELKDVENRLQELYKQRDSQGSNNDNKEQEEKTEQLKNQRDGLRSEKSNYENSTSTNPIARTKVRELNFKINDLTAKINTMRSGATG